MSVPVKVWLVTIRNGIAMTVNNTTNKKTCMRGYEEWLGAGLIRTYPRVPGSSLEIVSWSVKCFLFLFFFSFYSMFTMTATLKAAPLAPLWERLALDRKVTGSIFTWGTVLCSWARHFIWIALCLVPWAWVRHWLNPGRLKKCLKQMHQTNRKTDKIKIFIIIISLMSFDL